MTNDSPGSEPEQRRLSSPWYYASDSSNPQSQAGYAQPPDYGHSPSYGAPPGADPYLPRTRGRGRRRGGGGRGKLIGALAAVVAIAVAVSVFFVVRSHNAAHTTGFVPTGTTPDQDAQQIAAAFLQAWHSGNLDQASRYTDHPAAAKAALAVYQQGLHLRNLTGSAGSTTAVSATSEQVQLNINATVAVSGAPGALSSVWKYQSALTAYQQKGSDVWYVAWRPDVLAPNLTPTTHLAAIQVVPQVVSVGDSAGNDLGSYHDAGLTNIAGLLMKQPPPSRGKPGLYVQIETNTGKAVPNSQAVVVAPQSLGTLATTIDSRAESAARKAVGMHANSSMVVIQPSSGKILAIANNAGFNDFALTAQVAPGSTMKIITSTALFNTGVLTTQSPVACPATFTIEGITYHNDNNETLPAGTPFITDFAQSCNNAFTTQWSHLSGLLASTAKEYYGLNQPWNIGIGGLSASYFNAPADASGAQLAEEAFGQGSLSAAPLAMASVAATVESGLFHQPILVPGTAQVTAKPLPASTDEQLKQMMRAVVTSGTAAGIGLGPNVYAKTGTADVQNNVRPNSWIVAFDPTKDVAVAALVLNAGYGAEFAGPEAAAFLNAY